MSYSNPYLIMLGCFDTKGEAFSYLRDCLLAHGERVVALNSGIMGTTERFPVDIEADLITLEGGHDLSDLRERGGRDFAFDIMGKGASNIVDFLMAQGGIKGVIGIGGRGGTCIALSAMEKVPIGTPIVCLSTMAAEDLSPLIGSIDITIIYSTENLTSLNSISKLLIRQAAAAISAMGNTLDMNVREDPALSED